jgi:hypothetical protein
MIESYNTNTNPFSYIPQEIAILRDAMASHIPLMAISITIIITIIFAYILGKLIEEIKKKKSRYEKTRRRNEI